MLLQPATFEEFEREAARGNVVPVVRSVLADLQTPVGAFLRVAGGRAVRLPARIGRGRRAHRALLVSSAPTPELVVRGRGDTTLVERQGGETEELRGVRATDFLRDYFRAAQARARAGWRRWRAARSAISPTTRRAGSSRCSRRDLRPAEGRDDAVFMLFRTVLAFDRVRQQIEITSRRDDGGGGRESRAPARSFTTRPSRRRRGWRSLLSDGARAARGAGGERPGGARRRAAVSSRTGRARSSRRAVARIKEHIAAGDCYQAVLSQRFSKACSVEPLQIYRALRATNPSPYMYFLRTGRRGGRRRVARDAGALPRPAARLPPHRGHAAQRGATETEDWLLGEEMRADEKEVAEHTMLVDLGRNDLGRVADYGSVEVERADDGRALLARACTSSRPLRARLRDDRDRFDALAACFPAGTVTGAPKVRAMQIIGGLEPDARGVYAGAVLYVDYADNLDSCIAIRTVVVRDGVAHSAGRRRHRRRLRARARVRGDGQQGARRPQRGRDGGAWIVRTVRQ